MAENGAHAATRVTPRWQRMLGISALSAALLYLEAIFKISTSGGFLPAGPIIALFSLAIGQLLHLLCDCLPKPWAQRAAKLLMLLVLGVLFSVEYFVYRQFKLYYDPTTVLLGAGDVASQFGGTVKDLALSPQGLLHIALFMAPAALYLACGIGLRFDPAERITPRQGLLDAATVIVTQLVALALVSSGPYAEIYDARYSFQNAVSSFGLITALRKEATVALTGPATTFEIEEPSKETEEEQQVPEGPAVLDIDFEALAASTDNETWAELDRYVASLTPSERNEYTGLFEGYNLVFITAEAFSGEAIREDITPTLWRMWNEGIQLTDFYQFDTAGTTGGECANLFGLLATEGGSSVKGTADHNNYLTLGNLLNQRGYDGWAFHNNTYTYYGRDATHNNLGYNNGYMGYGNGMEQWVTWTWPESDLEMVQGTFDHVYGSSDLFNVYYMSVSGHNGYSRSENMMAEKNWDVVKDLPYSDAVKGYLAANVELDRAMEYLLARLEERGIADRTVVVISADHFPYGLDDEAPLGQLPNLSELYGFEITNIFEREHSRPIIWSGSLATREEPIVVDTPTMSIDLLPTLCNLFGLEWDSRLLPGRDVFAPNTEGMAFNLNYDWHTELGTYFGATGVFEPAEGADIPKDYVEAHNTLVANKISYCHGVLTSDYYRHVFGEPEDVQAVHDAAKAERQRKAEAKAEAEAKAKAEAKAAKDEKGKSEAKADEKPDSEARRTEKSEPNDVKDEKANSQDKKNEKDNSETGKPEDDKRAKDSKAEEKVEDKASSKDEVAESQDSKKAEDKAEESAESKPEDSSKDKATAESGKSQAEDSQPESASKNKTADG